MKPQCWVFPGVPPTWQLGLGRKATRVPRKALSPTKLHTWRSHLIPILFWLDVTLASVHCCLLPKSVTAKSQSRSHLNSEWFLYSSEENNSSALIFSFYYCIVFIVFVCLFILKCWQWKPGPTSQKYMQIRNISMCMQFFVYVL